MAKKLVLKPYEKLWHTNDGMLAFKTYLRIGNSALCRVDLRISETDSYAVSYIFSGGWIPLAEADGSMLQCHAFRPGDNRDKIVKAMREDAKAMAEETQVVMAFAGQEGTAPQAEEENIEKEPKGE
jgi:hypothetical protein